MGNMGRIKAFCPSAKMSFRLFFLKHRIFSTTLARISLDIEMYKFLPDASFLRYYV